MESLKQIAQYFASSAVIIAILIFIGKKYIENFIKINFQKKMNEELEKYKNSLHKQSVAYEFLVKREFEFYEILHCMSSELLSEMAYLDENRTMEEICGTIRKVQRNIFIANQKLIEYQAYIPVKLFVEISKCYMDIADELSLCVDDIEKMNFVSLKEEINEKIGAVHRYLRERMDEITR